MKINVLHHCSPLKKASEFCDILTILRWFLKLSHSAVAVPHHCRPLYMYSILYFYPKFSLFYYADLLYLPAGIRIITSLHLLALLQI